LKEWTLAILKVKKKEREIDNIARLLLALLCVVPAEREREREKNIESGYHI